MCRVKNNNFHICVKDYFVSPEFTAVKIFLVLNLETNVLLYSQWSQQVGVLLKLFLLLVIYCVEWGILCNLCSLASWLLFQKEKFVFVCDWCVWRVGKVASRTCWLFLVLRSRKLGMKDKQNDWAVWSLGVMYVSDICMWWSLWPVCDCIFF